MDAHSDTRRRYLLIAARLSWRQARITRPLLFQTRWIVDRRVPWRVGRNGRHFAGVTKCIRERGPLLKNASWGGSERGEKKIKFSRSTLWKGRMFYETLASNYGSYLASLLCEITGRSVGWEKEQAESREKTEGVEIFPLLLRNITRAKRESYYFFLLSIGLTSVQEWKFAPTFVRKRVPFILVKVSVDKVRNTRAGKIARGIFTEIYERGSRLEKGRKSCSNFCH